MKYRKKPVVIEAFRVGIDYVTPKWFDDAVHNKNIRVYTDGSCEIFTLEGIMKADEGDYIIQGIHGEIYPCKPDIFEKTYELVKEE